MLRVDELPPNALRVVAGIFGLIWGSFLNVVIHRAPRGMSVVRPGSSCPACGKPIAPWDNVPLFGWLLLRGKARCCGAKISPRYPLVEALGGAASLAVLEIVVFHMPAASAVRALFVYLTDFAMIIALIAGFFAFRYRFIVA